MTEFATLYLNNKSAMRKDIFEFQLLNMKKITKKAVIQNVRSTKFPVFAKLNFKH